ncbi:MAG: hypothetical protein K940chlam9_00018 [Chlamydiae bacterium]|nr:hypothetical protein [Chlamydiota bacterium]
MSLNELPLKGLKSNHGELPLNHKGHSSLSAKIHGEQNPLRGVNRILKEIVFTVPAVP